MKGGGGEMGRGEGGGDRAGGGGVFLISSKLVAIRACVD